MGGNILLHMATIQPDSLEALVVVSATMYPKQGRGLMQPVPVPTTSQRRTGRECHKNHKRGDQQIIELWDWTGDLQDSYDDMNFTPPFLSRVMGPTLIVYGDRDPLYAVEMAVEMYRAIPRSSLWVAPNGSHGPIFGDAASQFAHTALKFFRAAK